MAELHDLSPSSGSHRMHKRKGRGPGSGNGKTAGRGQKGQKSLIRRIPKRGFKNINRIEYQVVNVRDLEKVDGDVTPESMKAAGLVRSLRKPVKVLGVGEVSMKVSVSAHKFSATAQSKIEAAGGSVTVLGTSSSDD